MTDLKPMGLKFTCYLIGVDKRLDVEVYVDDRLDAQKMLRGAGLIARDCSDLGLELRGMIVKTDGAGMNYFDFIPTEYGPDITEKLDAWRAKVDSDVAKMEELRSKGKVN